MVGFVETHGRQRTAEQVGELSRSCRARRIAYRDTGFEEMDVDAILARRPAGGPRRRAGPHQRAGLRQREALAGRRGAARRRHRRDLHAEHPAPRVAQRRRRARSPGWSSARRSPTPWCGAPTRSSSSTSPPRRSARGWPAATSTPPSGSTPRSATTSARATSPRCASWPCSGSPTGSTRPSRSTGPDTGSASLGDAGAGRGRAVTGSPDGDRLVRRAARMAQRLDGDLVAVHVRPQTGLATAGGRAARAPGRLVERLGGTYREVVGRDVGEALVESARALDATQIVLGARSARAWAEFIRGSVVRTVIRLSGVGLDVHVIGREADAGTDAVALSQAAPAARAAAPARGARVRARAVGAPLLTLALTADSRPRVAVERAPPVPPARRGRVRRRRPVAGRSSPRWAASSWSTGISRRRSTPGRSATPRTCSPWSSSWRSPRR